MHATTPLIKIKTGIPKANIRNRIAAHGESLAFKPKNRSNPTKAQTKSTTHKALIRACLPQVRWLRCCCPPTPIRCPVGTTMTVEVRRWSLCAAPASISGSSLTRRASLYLNLQISQCKSTRSLTQLFKHFKWAYSTANAYNNDTVNELRMPCAVRL
jgi:hypothetical protein